MEFSEKIDLMITDMERELKKVRRARTGPGEHNNFITHEINEIIKDQSKREGSEPVKILGYALGKVGELIDKSFERLDTIERNIIVTIEAYQRVKDALVAHDNEKKQLEHIDNNSGIEEKEALSKPGSNVRKVGTRPKDNLSARRKKAAENSEKPKRKRVAKKKKTTKVKEE